MSLDRGLTLTKTGRNEYEVGTINLSSEHTELKLRTSNLHAAMIYIEEQQRELPYEALTISGFAKKIRPIEGSKRDAKIRKTAGDIYHLSVVLSGLIVASGDTNLHRTLAKAEQLQYRCGTRIYVDFEVSGFSRRPPSPVIGV